MSSGKFSGSKRDPRKHILVRVNEVLRNFHVEQGRVRGKLSLALILVTMRRDEVRAVGRAVDRDFSLRPAADGADFLALRRTKSYGFTVFADRTSHSGSRRCTNKPAEYSRES